MDRVIGDMEAQLLCSLFEAACFLTRLPVWNDGMESSEKVTVRGFHPSKNR